MERRNHQTKVERRGEGDEPKGIGGLGAVFYDGTPRTEFPLWTGAVERIMPGAFDEAVDKKTGDDVRGLFNHDPNMVLGRTESGTMRLKSSKEGLEYEIDPAETNVFRDVSQHLERGDVTGSSFSFTIRKTEDGEIGERWYDDEERNLHVREVTAAKLFDVGPVTFPAYSASTAGLRSEDGNGPESELFVEARSSFEEFRKSLESKESEADQRQIDADRQKQAEAEAV